MSMVLRTATELSGSPSAPQSSAPRPPLAPSHPAAPERNLRQYALILGQLAVLFLVVDRFQLEGESFRRLMLLTIGGFAVHYFLPFGQRLRFFVLLSLAGIVVVLGPRRRPGW